MFGAAWVVGVAVNFTSNGALTMARLASSTRMANASLGAQQGIISKNQLAMMRYGERMEAIRMSALRMGTALSGALAAGGIATMVSAVSEASKLQQILLSIKNETGASNAQIGKFYNAAFDIGNRNGMSPESAGEILRTISRLSAGQFTVDKMIKVAPTVADFASKVHFNRPDISVEEAAKTGIQTAHLFRAYQPAPLTKLLDSAYRLSGMMSEKPDAALRQMSYYVPMFKAMNVSDETSIATMALLDRAGFRNKVGTNVRALVLEGLGPLQLTKHAQTGKMHILEEMGLFKNGKFAWNNKDGSLNYFGELQSIGNWAQARRDAGVPASTIAQQMFGALGKQGGTIGALFMDKQMAPILDGLKRYLRDPNVGLAAAGKNRDQGLGFQFTRAVSNFRAVMVEVAYPWLRDLTGIFKSLGDNLHSLQHWFHEHRDVEKNVGKLFLGGTLAAAGLAFAGALQLVLKGLAFTGIGGALSGVGGWFMGIVRVVTLSFGLIAPRLLGFIPVIGWVITAIMGGIEAFKHASDIAWIFGKIAGYLQFTLGPKLQSAFLTGWDALMKALGQIISGGLKWLTEFAKDPRTTIKESGHKADMFLAGKMKEAADWAKHLLLVEQHAQKSMDPNASKLSGRRLRTREVQPIPPIVNLQSVIRPTFTPSAATLMPRATLQSKRPNLAEALSRRDRTRDVVHHHTGVNLTVNVTTTTKDVKEAGAIVGQRVVHELRKAGLVRNGPAFGAHATPAAH